MDVGVHVEVGKTAAQNFIAEVGVERGVEFHKLLQRQIGKRKFFRNEECVAERLRQTEFHIDAVHENLSGFRTQKSAHQIEKRGFPGAVLAQQTIDSTPV